MSVSILIGDCREKLRELPDQSVHCCVTSPPYFGLRDYGHAGQMGLEPTPDEFVAGMVAVFREVRRVLRDDGTLWLNIGDTYNSNPSTSDIPRSEQGNGNGAFQIPPEKHMQANRAKANKAQPLIDMGIKKKDLIGIPWLLAFALRADGWYLRQEIIWHKPNPMPESVRDRCTKSHEQIFLLSKSPRYFFDGEAIAEPGADASVARLRQNVEAQQGSHRVPGKTNGAMKAVGRSVAQHKQAAMGRNMETSSLGSNDEPLVRNKRSVWTVTTQPFSEAHFATYPPALIEPCILAGCPEGGTVLDPFGGAGTTGLVADRYGRNAILCELNPEYAEIARKRLAGDGGMFADIKVAAIMATAYQETSVKRAKPKRRVRESRRTKQRDPIAMRAREIGIPAEQITAGAFELHDVSNYSDGDQRSMVRSGERQTVRRRQSKLDELFVRGVIDKREQAVCEWYKSAHEEQYDTKIRIADWEGGAGSTDKAFGHWPTGQALGSVTLLAFARSQVNPALLPLFDRVVIHERPLGKLRITFRTAVRELLAAIEGKVLL